MKTILRAFLLTLMTASLIACALVDLAIIANIWNLGSVEAIGAFCGASAFGIIIYFGVKTAVEGMSGRDF